MAELSQFLFALRKFREFLKIFFFKLKIAGAGSFLDFGCLVCGIIHKVLVVKDLEIKTEYHWGSGGDLFFDGQKWGFLQKISNFFLKSFVNALN